MSDLNNDQLYDRFDRALALYYVCEQYHGGQASRLYRILSRLASQWRFTPGRMYRSHIDREEYAVRNYAARYLRAARRSGDA